jgi:hypothetical protein
LSVFALPLSETLIPPGNYEPSEESQKIADCFCAAFSANLLAGTSCRFFQRENKTLPAVAALRLLVQRREAAKDIPASVTNEGYRIRTAVASPVKISSAETVAASAPQKRKLLPAELVEKQRKG